MKTILPDLRRCNIEAKVLPTCQSLRFIRYGCYLLYFYCVVCSLFLHSTEENQFFRRIQAHLIIKDFKSAREESQYALQSYPDSIILHEIYIKSLASLGEEREMLRAWESYCEHFPEKKNHRELIEEMCWGILRKASISPSLTTRLLALLAGFFSQDSRGIAILRQGMRDNNTAIRAASVELAGHLHDTKLIDEVKLLFQQDQAWIVRQSVLQAIGKMKIKDLSAELEGIIALENTSAEEKAIAIKSLIQLLDEVKQEEIIRLVNSNRAGLRLLACKAIAHFRSERDIDQLFKLAQDNHANVRIAAIQAIGLIHLQGEKSEAIAQLAREKINDSDFKVALSAAWLLTLYSPSEGKEALKAYLNNNKQEIRLIAAAALSASGRYGIDLAIRQLYSHPDPYVRLNLALSVITQRKAIDKAAETIYKIVNSNKERWVKIDEGIFEAIAPRTISKSYISTDSDSTPEMDNQVVRLEVLSNLAIIDPKKAQSSIRLFLMERTWGVTGTAAALLLMEGNDSAVDLVENLLQDENHKVRMQAAMILSIWSRDEKAIAVLEKHYWMADKEMKERLLESIGRIGSMSSVPFLLNVLKEPSQHLRIITASALIQCLNH